MLSQTEFLRNKAAIGGAIRWTYKEPDMGTNQQFDKTTATQAVTYGTLTFRSNEASVYGPELAGVTQRLVRFKTEE